MLLSSTWPRRERFGCSAATAWCLPYAISARQPCPDDPEACQAVAGGTTVRGGVGRRASTVRGGGRAGSRWCGASHAHGGDATHPRGAQSGGPISQHAVHLPQPGALDRPEPVVAGSGGAGRGCVALRWAGRCPKPAGRPAQGRRGALRLAGPLRRPRRGAGQTSRRVEAGRLAGSGRLRRQRVWWTVRRPKGRASAGSARTATSSSQGAVPGSSSVRWSPTPRSR